MILVTSHTHRLESSLAACADKETESAKGWEQGGLASCLSYTASDPKQLNPFLSTPP